MLKDGTPTNIDTSLKNSWLQLYHAQRWHSHHQTPMIVTDIGHIFQNDFILLHHDKLGTIYGKPLLFYNKVS